MPRRIAAAAALLLATPRAASPQGAPPPPVVVLELFTSQSCSSCPQADALLGELARSGDGTLLPLAFHVTYWGRLGWKDRFSPPEATERQRRYAALWRRDHVYTPQLVVQGERDAVGSDRRAVTAAIAAATRRAAAATGPGIALSVGDSGDRLIVTVGAGQGTGTLWLIGFDPRHVTPVRGGENAGRTLVQTQVVRGIAEAGTWRGEALRLDVAPPPGARALPSCCRRRTGGS
jgi:hypothetical protein